MKKILSCVLAIIFSLCCICNCFAQDDAVNKVQNIDNLFLTNVSVTSVQETSLLSYLGDARLIDFYENSNPVGYAVIIDNQVVEFSEKASPYLLYSSDYDNKIFYYDYANYGEIVENSLICFSSDGELLPDVSVEGDIALAGVLPGVSPQLQESHNCVATALSNLIWYWGNHGKSSLISGRTFTNVKNDITTHFNNYGQGFSNNAVLAIANVYGRYVSPAVTFSGGAVWSNSSATMVADIDSGYPCLVGFKAAQGSYSTVVGHMTMCFGYYYSGSNLYIVLADGHSSSSVTKIWASYNDCTIRVRPS